MTTWREVRIDSSASAHRRWRSAAARLGAALGLIVLATGVTTAAAVVPAPSPALSITPITWNVIGLDSNRPTTSGPDTFPVAARICNTGSASATGVGSSFVFDSTNAAISLVGASSLSLGTLNAGRCVDAYYNVVVTRAAASFDQTRSYHITGSATGVATVSTPAGRELYVEHLVSQARNAVNGISGSAIDVAPTTSAHGHATVVVGRTYTFTVDSKTATGGYEQLESFLNFPNTIFQILSVDASYAQPTGATNDKVYADACGWDNNVGPRPPHGTYLACAGPEGYTGGKAGGDPITTTYTVKVISAGNGSLGTLIYDFSGSSFHYNGDFGTNLTAVDFVAVNPADLALAKAHNGTFVAGVDATYTLTASNVGDVAATGTTTITDVLPSGLDYVSATGTGWACGAAGQTVTCTSTSDIAAGGSASPVTLTVKPTSGGSVTNSATVANAGDANAANNSSSDTTVVDHPPVATDDAASTSADTPVSVDVLLNDSDADSDSLTVVTPSPSASHGTVACSATACLYTPDGGFAGTDTFDYTISDGHGGTASATVTITVSAPPASSDPVSDPPVVDHQPVAVADAVTTAHGSPVEVDVLSNDDPGDGPDTVSGHTTPSHGAVACSATTCTYTPDPDTSGVDSFSYTIVDSDGDPSTALVSVTVDAAPVVDPGPGPTPDLGPAPADPVDPPAAPVDPPADPADPVDPSPAGPVDPSPAAAALNAGTGPAAAAEPAVQAAVVTAGGSSPVLSATGLSALPPVALALLLIGLGSLLVLATRWTPGDER